MTQGVHVVDTGGRIKSMTSQNVRFVAVETVKKPTTVKFKTKSGKTVAFKAIKTFRKEKAVRFRAKKK